MSAGSRLEANVYKVIENLKDGTYSMGHICHFMRSFEQHDNDQDLRIMAVAALQTHEIYSVFGTSAGEIEFHKLNLEKRRL